MVIKPVGRHGQVPSVEANETFFSKMFIYEPSQFIDPSIRTRKGYGSAPRAGYSEPHHFDGNQSKQAAHRQTITFARQRTLFVQIGAERRQSLCFHRTCERQQGLCGDRLEPRQRLSRLIAECVGNIFGEANDPTVGNLWRETEAMRGRRRHQNEGWCGEPRRCCLEAELATTFLDEQHLKQISVTVSASCPIVN